MEFVRLLPKGNRTFFLFGPRGSGKTTWLKSQFKNALWFNLLHESTYQTFLRDPQLFRIQILSHDAEWVVVDEIQRLPSLLNEVHNFIEEKTKKFALSASSIRKLKKSNDTNLLGGRASKKEMYPLVAAELNNALKLEDILAYGTLPLVLAEDDKVEVLKAYTENYLKFEIQSEALVRNLAGFSRFLPVAALFHGQTLSVQSLARDAGVARTTIQGFLEILEDTLLAYQLPAFEGNLRVREKKHPKFYWIDSGIVRSIKRNFGPLYQDERGPLFEGWIALQLKATNSYREIYDEIYYWSPAQSKTTEVDFLLKKKSEFVAIEAKSSNRIRPEDKSGLEAIAELKGLKRKIIVYAGENSYRDKDIEILSLSDFYKQLEIGFF